jgi:predicted SprT family Zn-dependent metalloprotease
MNTAQGNSPTHEQWQAYQRVYDYMNEILFEGRLPGCILNLSRRSHSYGFFAPIRWHNKESTTHEISLNPDMLERPLIDIMSTLVHEMCHLWKHEFGKKKGKTTAYHCKEWAAKMVEVGLIPFNIKHPELQTGYRVSHTIAEGGRFMKAFNEMPPAYYIPWQSSKPGRSAAHKQRSNKVKYTCIRCQNNVWGKSGLELTCNVCKQPFQEQQWDLIVPLKSFTTAGSKGYEESFLMKRLVKEVLQ